MTESQSIYLDLVRFTAAVCVVINHFLSNDIFPPTIAGSMPDFGREAVMTFFVLSGYVITYTTRTRNHTLKSYFVARAARIYSVAIPILILAFLVDSTALQFNSENYHHLYQYEKFYIYLPLHIGFFGEIWFLAERPFTIPTYWSLSYEVWYYVIFACLFFYTGRKRLVLTFIVALIVGYQHWLLFPVWLSGVALYRFQDSVKLSVSSARIGLVATFFLILIMKFTGIDMMLWQLGRDIWPFPSLPQGSADQFLLDYIVCIIMFANFYCARYAELGFIEAFGNSIRAIASYTFTLYLIHTLVILTWLRNFPYDNERLSNLTALILLIVLTTWCVGNLTEKRKAIYTYGFSRLANWVEKVILKKPRIDGMLRPNKKRVAS